MSSYSFTKVGNEYQMGVFPNSDEYTGRETQIEIKYVVAGIINTFPPQGRTSHISRLKEFVLVIHGQTGSEGKKVAGASAKIDLDSLNDVYQQGLPDNVAFQKLMGLNLTPTHIIGVVVRPLSYYF